uniref:Uncharacterized protein n=1 Tax=Rhizophora mucronata TaxID=61149 RepID=A0A2P2PTI6_RHIMU
MNVGLHCLCNQLIVWMCQSILSLELQVRK